MESVLCIIDQALGLMYLSSCMDLASISLTSSPFASMAFHHRHTTSQVSRMADPTSYPAAGSHPHSPLPALQSQLMMPQSYLLPILILVVLLHFLFPSPSYACPRPCQCHRPNAQSRHQFPAARRRTPSLQSSASSPSPQPCRDQFCQSRDGPKQMRKGWRCRNTRARCVVCVSR